MKKTTVLSVDDDENLQVVLREYLEQDGYRFVGAASGTELLDKVESAQPDVILLDLVLPDQDGLGLISSIRGKSKAGIIVVSGKSETTDRVVGLEMGADDYITKPFELRELSARIKAVMRRNAAPAEKADDHGKATKITFGNWVLDRSQYQLFDTGTGKSGELTSGEFRLLEALAMAPNRVLSREHLFELTRNGDYDVYDRAIDIQIARIRKKLNDDPRSPQLIKTVRGVGYMFCGETSTS
ncbi:MAG TPA: response regulator transcription factor [Patescibacteria group bacterium]|nr:response regulator transcription factor [Patescibacteria group bacterium]